MEKDKNRIDQNLTRFLEKWRDGDYEAANTLYAIAYNDIRRIARSLMRGERPGHTWGATALCNEAWMKMVRSPIYYNDSDEFFKLIRHAMKQLLIDYAKRRNAGKRPDAHIIDLSNDDNSFDPIDSKTYDFETIYQLEQALDALAGEDPRAAQILCYRKYVGLSEEETAELIGKSTRLVRQELKISTKWVAARINRPQNNPSLRPALALRD